MSPTRPDRTAPILTATLILSLATAGPAHAGEQPGGQDVQARVEAVQPPAWVQRGQQAVAMRPGILVRPGDMIHTGDQGRAWVDMADGTRLMLGSDSHLSLVQMRSGLGDAGSTFTAALDLTQGTVGMRTDQTVAAANRRIDLRSGVVTASIRGGEAGTELIGVRNRQEDRIISVDGSVRVLGEGGTEIAGLSGGGATVGARTGEEPSQGSLSPEQLEAAGAWTQMQDDRGRMVTDGGWEIVLISVKEHGNAVSFAQELARVGFPVDLQEADVDGETWHRVFVPHVASKADADRFAEDLKEHGVNSPWIRRKP